MIKAYLNDLELPRLEVPLEREPIENAKDVETLDGSVHSDWVSLEHRWTMAWRRLTQDEYDDIYDIYTSQFETGSYPTLTIDYYGVDEVPVRMKINTKDIRNWGRYIENVEITLRETTSLSSPDIQS